MRAIAYAIALPILTPLFVTAVVLGALGFHRASRRLFDLPLPEWIFP